jgi:hypothetical protein
MATLLFSSTFVTGTGNNTNGLLQTNLNTNGASNDGRLFGSTNTQYLGTTANGSASMISGGGTQNHAMIRVYQGAVPTFATLTDFGTRSTDLLWWANLDPAVASYTPLGVVNDSARFLIAIKNVQVAAVGTGLATWFLMHHNGNLASTATVTSLTTDKGCMLGTVGAAGSGADMEIGDPNIVSGVGYTCAGVYFNYPLTWTV